MSFVICTDEMPGIVALMWRTVYQIVVGTLEGRDRIGDIGVDRRII
jgi:hypothetical protein